jgi:hypothetical protein
MFGRRRFKQPLTIQDRLASFPDRLASFAKEAREKASLLPPGQDQNELISKAREAEFLSRIDGWLNSPGVQPPK